MSTANELGNEIANNVGPSNEVEENQHQQEETAAVPPKKKVLTSKVWVEFHREETQVEVDGKMVMRVKATCKHCARVFDGTSNRGTSQLKNHLKTHSTDSRQKLLQTSMKSVDGTCTLSAYKYDESVSRIKLLHMFILHEYPFTMVEHAGFIDFVKSLRPSFHLKSRITHAKQIMGVYVEEKKKLYELFASMSCRVSATMDLWTSRQNKSYLCVTAHFIGEDWTMQKRIINFIHMGEKHTGLNLSKTFIKNMMGWNLDRKLFSLTLDNDRANDVCVRDIVNHLTGENELVCEGTYFHLRCATHVINLVVQNGLKGIKNAIENIREIVMLVKSSTLQREDFEKAAKECKLKTRRALSTDVATRWNSTYMMLRDALYYKDAFKRLQRIDPVKFHMCPTSDQWNDIRVLCECLKGFFNVTKLLLGTSYPTANLFFEEFCEIKLQISEWCTGEDNRVRAMALLMKEKFDKYWEKMNIILAVACFLDPRYKCKMVKCYFPEAEKEMGVFLSAIKSIYEEYVVKYSPPLDGTQTAGQQSSQVGGSAFNDDRSKKRRFTPYIEEENIALESPKSDLEQYIAENVLPWDDNNGSFDILGWWKCNGSKYPILAKVARDVLAIPVSTVASESAFSTGGRVVDPHRSSLDPESIEALICAQDWIRYSKPGAGQSIFNDIEELVGRSHSTLVSSGEGTSSNPLMP